MRGVNRCREEANDAVDGRPLCRNHADQQRQRYACEEACEVLKRVDKEVPLENGLRRQVKKTIGRLSNLLEGAQT